MLRWPLIILVLLGQAHASFMDNLSYSGQVSFAYRQFEGDSNEENVDHQQDNYAKFNATYEGDSYKVFLSAFGRIDSADSSRNIFNMDEAFYKYTKDAWSISVGNHIFNWSVLEIFHPVDSINARNLDSNAVAIERLGQPAAVITREFDSSILQIISLLKTVSPIMPSRRNRNGPQKVRLETPRFVENDDEYTTTPTMPEGIIRYLHNFESFDLDLHIARKYDTANPVIGSIDTNVTDRIIATPFYLPVTQYGMAVQGTYEAFIYKAEHIYYDFDNYDVCFGINCVVNYVSREDFSLTAIGLEYSKSYANDHSGTFFFEYQTVLGTTIEEARVINAFQRDFGIGYRHSFNNFDGHEIIAVAIGDVDQYHEQVYQVSHSFRLSESWKWHTEVRIVKADSPTENLRELDNFSGLKPIADSDNIFLRLTKFF